VFNTKDGLLRLRAIGLSANEAHQIIMLVQKWAHDSGEEWAVDRVKSIKLDLVRHFAGLSPTKSHSWIHYGPKGPRGPFRVLFALSRKDFRKAWNAMMVYTGFLFDHPELRVTERQWRRAEAAINRQAPGPEVIIEGLRLIHQSPLAGKLRVEVGSETGSPLVDYQASPSRRAPKGFRTVPEVEGVIDSLRYLLRRSEWTDRYWDILSGSVRGLENHVLPQLELNRLDDLRSGGSVQERPEMGLVALIQEAGYKLRFAANPARIYQVALKPLGDALFEALRRLPNDFTFDQVAGVEAVQGWLQDGLVACSMDLSNATDNFPMVFQLELLSQLGVNGRWLSFLQDCCRGDWYTKTSNAPYAPTVLIRWSVGTPLGLYPTFAMFALAHHCVVQWCFSRLDKPVDDKGRYPYAIVGDDCTIMDAEVASLYRQVMEAWGVPVDPVKSLESATTAQFVGRVITGDTVVQGFKWKGRVSDESFVDFARNLGPRSLVMMRPRQRRVLSYIADLPEPYGLGWNPLGIPLEERLTPAIERAFAADVRLRTFSRRAARFSHLSYMSDDISGTPVPGFESDAAYLASDQEVSQLVHEVLPMWLNVPYEVALWPNLQEVILERGGPLARDARFRSMLSRISYVETRKEAPALVLLERKIRRALARSL